MLLGLACLPFWHFPFIFLVDALLIPYLVRQLSPRERRISLSSVGDTFEKTSSSLIHDRALH